MELRDYQLEAVIACHKASRLAVQAPTGSGKSWIIAQYIKELKKQDPGVTVVLSTGFNNLVFDLHKTLAMFDVKARVLIGRAATVCGRSGHSPENPLVPYTEDKKIQPKAMGCSQCISSCNYKPRVIPGEVLVTNHSMMAVLSEQIDSLDKAVIIVDEAHTLYNYISSYNEALVTLDHIKQLQLELVKKSLPAIKAKKLIDIATKGGITEELVKAAYGFFPDLVPEIDRAAQLLKAPANSLFKENLPEGFRVRRFVGEKFILRHKTLFFTATINGFHAKYLALTSKNILKVNSGKPKNSLLHTFKVGKQLPNKMHVRDLVSKRSDKRGLILSPSFADLQEYVGALPSNINKTDKPLAFTGNGILYGSRRLFQGVNIDDLNYIIITKLPFPIYNEEYVKWSEYVQRLMGISTWEITIAQVESDLIQAAGRLWRRPDQEGEIHIALYGMPYDRNVILSVAEFFNLKIVA